MKSVAVIGAGITGLTAAFYLKRNGVAVTVYETAERAGGVIRSARQNGFLAEFGPNSILETSPKIPRLISDLKLESRRLYPSAAAKNRYLVCRQQLVTVPSSQKDFLTTKLFSAKSKLSLLREPFLPARRDGKDESVAEFVRRRLNQEFLERAVDALVAGIYAGDVEKLSVKQAFPKLFEVEQKFGSLIKGQLFGPGQRKEGEEVSRRDAKMFSFDEGLQVLTDKLRDELDDAIRFGISIEKISKTANGWTISSRDFSAEHSAAIFCGNAYTLAKMQIESAQTVSTAIFSEIRYAPVASIVLGFRREDIAHPLDGFGMLIPKIEGRKILGTIFSSSLFPDRAPQNFVTLTSYAGGERQPELASLAGERLLELVLADLRELLGVNGKPQFQHVAFFPKAIPQYNVGYEKFKSRLSEIEAQEPGLFFAGCYRNGVSLGDSIVSGRNVADNVLTFLR
ncbi:MAG TPA: protoporphyrinogen oxidase [Verrucomicrobiae bacterium]|nr:protoporphyrinogen oxidase [Verrucomicrobiae bacterium]